MLTSKGQTFPFPSFSFLFFPPYFFFLSFSSGRMFEEKIVRLALGFSRTSGNGCLRFTRLAVRDATTQTLKKVPKSRALRTTKIVQNFQKTLEKKRKKQRKPNRGTCSTRLEIVICICICNLERESRRESWYSGHTNRIFCVSGVEPHI